MKRYVIQGRRPYKTLYGARAASAYWREPYSTIRYSKFSAPTGTAARAERERLTKEATMEKQRRTCGRDLAANQGEDREVEQVELPPGVDSTDDPDYKRKRWQPSVATDEDLERRGLKRDADGHFLPPKLHHG